MKAKTFIQKAGLIIVSILLSLFIAEVLLRWLYPDSSKYYVWQPNLQHTFTPDSTILYGISGKKKFTINERGLRGELFVKNVDGEDSNGSAIMPGMEGYPYNRLFLGGSTTECLYLDNHETWWYLWDSLGPYDWPEVSSASLGKSGITSRELYLHLKYIVPQLPDVNEVVIMPGLNDLMKRLSKDSLYDANFEFTPEVEDSLVRTIFLHKSRKTEQNWWRRTALFQLVQGFYHAFKPGGVEWMEQDDNGKSLKQWRLHRTKASEIRESLPDMTAALKEYERNLELIREEAHRQHVALYFITQPTIYKDTMNAFENSLLWMGGIGAYQKEPDHVYYSAKALKQGMDMYNDVLLDFCNKHDIICADAASEIPRNTSIFYDDCHFNENGARVFADYLYKLRFR